MEEDRAEREAMKAIAQKITDVLVILETGVGKTATFAGPICFENGITN